MTSTINLSKLCQHSFFDYFIVFIISILAFSNTFNADFVYDDSQAIVTNPVVNGDLQLSEVWRLDFWGHPMSRGSHKSYRPLTTLSFRINAAFFGMKPYSFHVVNVLLHAVVSCLVLLFIRRFDFFPRSTDAPLLTSLFFAVHPIHCEAVAGIVGRADVLAAMVVLIGILLHDSYENTAMTVGCTVIATCFKETGIMLPSILIAFVLLHSKKSPSDIVRSVYYLLFVFISISMIRHAINEFETPRFSKSDNPVAHHPSLMVRTLTFLYLPLFHLKLMMYPKFLSFDWSMDSIPLVTSPTDSRFIISLALYSCAMLTCSILLQHSGTYEKLRRTVSTWRISNRKRSYSYKNHSTKTSRQHSSASQKVLYAATMLILPFIPASNLFYYVGFVAAERTLYLPSVGYCILVGMLYNFCCLRYNRALMVSLGITVLILHTTRTYKRNMDWRDEESLYKSALKLNPPKAYSNLGRVYASQMRFDEAEAAYKSAIHYRPNMADTWYNLGVLYQEKKMSNKSIECYEISIGIRKTFAVAYLNLGIVYEEIGDRQRSMSIWQACADIDGSMIKAQREHQNAQTSCRFRLGKMLIQERSLTRAQLILEEAIQKAPRKYPFLASLLYSYGEVLEMLGQDAKAERSFQAALGYAPDHIPTLLTMAHLRNKQNRTAESNIYFSKALATAPYLAEVHHHIGLAAASRGDVAGAEAAYKNALKLVGTHRVTLTALATLLREQGRYDRSEEVLRTLQFHHPSAESYGDYGAILHINGKFDEAKRLYEKSLLLDPSNNVVKSNLRKLEQKIASMLSHS